MAQVFRSRVDWWLGLILVSLPLGGVVAMVALMLGDDPKDVWIGAGSLAFVAVLYVGVVWPVRYELEANELVIRFGLVRSRIRYEKIRGVKPTSNPVSSPALSLRRLWIDTGVSALGPNISPVDRQAFIEALVEHTPHLRVQGDRLVPVDSDPGP